jgi:hypothetical protein
MDIAVPGLVPQFILAILEFTHTLILVLDFLLLDSQQLLTEMALSTAMVTEPTLLQLRREQHMVLLRMRPWFRCES